jgi:glycosyltransferase involved in cell wall biosynthesis
MPKLRTEYNDDAVCGKYRVFPQSDGDKEGGLRTKGIYKKDTEENPLVTYVTVVYNRVDTIERCMKSVWEQTYQNVEYIVVDGASTDGTTDIIEKNADKIDYYISQKDTGIYNAMNKGIALARGRFICFMNSDDECVPQAAEKAMAEYRKTGADIVCGTRNLYVKGIYSEEVTYPRYCIKHSNFRYIQMYHQATYSSYELFDKIGGFDENYSLLSDWIWESAAIDADAEVAFCDDVLTKFNYDGASAKGIVKRDEEWIEWTMKSFSSLTKEDAELFVYSIDRDRHPMFDFGVLRKEAFKYKSDLNFQKAFWEDCLMACIEQELIIDKMLGESPLNINKIFVKYKKKFPENILVFDDISKWIEDKLMESLSKQNFDIFSKLSNDMDSLEIIRRFQIDALCAVYKKEYFYLNPKYVAESIGRYGYYRLCRKAGKSADKSRKFYLSVRAQWKLD